MYFTDHYYSFALHIVYSPYTIHEMLNTYRHILIALISHFLLLQQSITVSCKLLLSGSWEEVFHYNIIVIIIITVINKITNTSSLGNTYTKIHEKNTLFHKDSPTSIILQIMLWWRINKEQQKFKTWYEGAQNIWYLYKWILQYISINKPL